MVYPEGRAVEKRNNKRKEPGDESGLRDRGLEFYTYRQKKGVGVFKEKTREKTAISQQMK